MCGIFAYSGTRSAPKILLEGLKKLEYRGYDSSGIAFFHKDFVKKFRVCGDVSQLKNKMGTESYTGFLGIGHTRWATHGSPSEQNAHPHQSSSIYIVHNGVIENEEELKKRVGVKRLTSQTDSELIAHLLFDFYKELDKDFLKSVFKTTSCLKGSYAVVALCEDRPDELIAFKKGPPLILCQGEEGYFVSSDLQGVIEYSKQFIFLEDGDIAHIQGQKFQIYNFQGEKISREFKTVNYDNHLSEKKGYPHFMLKEIFEQPVSITRSLSRHVDKKNQLLNFKTSKGDQKTFDSLFETHSRMLILACGSSYYAGLFAKFCIESLSPMQVDVEMASEFIYKTSFIPAKTPVLFISQSGETADILTALKQTQEFDLTNISLCNVKGSGLDRQADYNLHMEAGVEVGVASTKTFSSSLVMLSLLALHIAKTKKYLKSNTEKAILKHLLALPSYIEETLFCDKFFAESASQLKQFSGYFYLGRGLYYSVALEGALKLKEIAYLHAEAYPSGEMKHGPLAMIDKNTLVVVLLPQKGVLYDKTLTNLKEVRARGASIFGVGGVKSDELKKLCDYFIALPVTHDLFHPLLALIPLQMMSYHISSSFGYNADRPRNLAKSVTVE